MNKEPHFFSVVSVTLWLEPNVLLGSRPTGAIGEQELETIFHLRLVRIERQNTLVDDDGALRPMEVFVDEAQLGQGADVVGIQFQGLLQTSLSTRQIAGLMPKPAIQAISGRQLGLMTEPIFDHVRGFRLATLTNDKRGQGKPASGMIGRLS